MSSDNCDQNGNNSGNRSVGPGVPDPNKEGILKPENNMPEKRSQKDGQNYIAPSEKSTKRIRPLGSFARGSVKEIEDFSVPVNQNSKKEHNVPQPIDKTSKDEAEPGLPNTRPEKDELYYADTETSEDKISVEVASPAERDGKSDNEVNISSDSSQKESPEINQPQGEVKEDEDIKIDSEATQKTSDEISIQSNRQIKDSNLDVDRTHTQKRGGEYVDENTHTQKDFVTKEVRGEDGVIKEEDSIDATTSAKSVKIDYENKNAIDATVAFKSPKELLGFDWDEVKDKEKTEENVGPDEDHTSKEEIDFPETEATEKTEEEIPSTIAEEKEEVEIERTTSVEKDEVEVNEAPEGEEKSELDIPHTESEEKQLFELDEAPEGEEKSESEIPYTESEEKQLLELDEASAGEEKDGPEIENTTSVEKDFLEIEEIAVGDGKPTNNEIETEADSALNEDSIPPSDVESSLLYDISTPQSGQILENDYDVETTLRNKDAVDEDETQNGGMNVSFIDDDGNIVNGTIDNNRNLKSSSIDSVSPNTYSSIDTSSDGVIHEEIYNTETSVSEIAVDKDSSEIYNDNFTYDAYSSPRNVENDFASNTGTFDITTPRKSTSAFENRVGKEDYVSDQSQVNANYDEFTSPRKVDTEFEHQDFITSNPRKDTSLVESVVGADQNPTQQSQINANYNISAYGQRSNVNDLITALDDPATEEDESQRRQPIGIPGYKSATSINVVNTTDDDSSAVYEGTAQEIYNDAGEVIGSTYYNQEVSNFTYYNLDDGEDSVGALNTIGAGTIAVKNSAYASTTADDEATPTNDFYTFGERYGSNAFALPNITSTMDADNPNQGTGLPDSRDIIFGNAAQGFISGGIENLILDTTGLDSAFNTTVSVINTIDDVIKSKQEFDVVAGITLDNVLANRTRRFGSAEAAQVLSNLKLNASLEGNPAAGALDAITDVSESAGSLINHPAAFAINRLRENDMLTTSSKDVTLFTQGKRSQPNFLGFVDSIGSVTDSFAVTSNYWQTSASSILASLISSDEPRPYNKDFIRTNVEDKLSEITEAHITEISRDLNISSNAVKKSLVSSYEGILEERENVNGTVSQLDRLNLNESETAVEDAFRKRLINQRAYSIEDFNGWFSNNSVRSSRLIKDQQLEDYTRQIIINGKTIEIDNPLTFNQTISDTGYILLNSSSENGINFEATYGITADMLRESTPNDERNYNRLFSTQSYVGATDFYRELSISSSLDEGGKVTYQDLGDPHFAVGNATARNKAGQDNRGYEGKDLFHSTFKDEQEYFSWSQFDSTNDDNNLFNGLNSIVAKDPGNVPANDVLQNYIGLGYTSEEQAQFYKELSVNKTDVTFTNTVDINDPHFITNSTAANSFVSGGTGGIGKDAYYNFVNELDDGNNQIFNYSQYEIDTADPQNILIRGLQYSDATEKNNLYSYENTEFAGDGSGLVDKLLIRDVTLVREVGKNTYYKHEIDNGNTDIYNFSDRDVTTDDQNIFNVIANDPAKLANANLLTTQSSEFYIDMISSNTVVGFGRNNIQNYNPSYTSNNTITDPHLSQFKVQYSGSNQETPIRQTQGKDLFVENLAKTQNNPFGSSDVIFNWSGLDATNGSDQSQYFDMLGSDILSNEVELSGGDYYNQNQPKNGLSVVDFKYRAKLKGPGPGIVVRDGTSKFTFDDFRFYPNDGSATPITSIQNLTGDGTITVDYSNSNIDNTPILANVPMLRDYTRFTTQGDGPRYEGPDFVSMFNEHGITAGGWKNIIIDRDRNNLDRVDAIDVVSDPGTFVDSELGIVRSTGEQSYNDRRDQIKKREILPQFMPDQVTVKYAADDSGVISETTLHEATVAFNAEGDDDNDMRFRAHGGNSMLEYRGEADRGESLSTEKKSDFYAKIRDKLGILLDPTYGGQRPDNADNGCGYLKVIKNPPIKDGDNKNNLYYNIPMQFNPEITGESRTANWSQHTALGRTNEHFIWSNTAARTIQFKTTYAVVAPGRDAPLWFKDENNKNIIYDSWATDWTEEAVSAILNKYRGLLIPKGFGDDDLKIERLDGNRLSPPVIKLIFGTDIMSMFSDTPGDELSFSNWIATDLNIDPRIEAGYTAARNPRIYDITMTLKEAVPSWRSYQTHAHLGIGG